MRQIRGMNERQYITKGCFLTTAQELGTKIIDLGGGDVGVLLTPKL